MSKEINVELTGKNIKRICEERGLGVRDLQQVLGIASAQAIYKWFEGKNIPSIDNLISISYALDVTLEELIVLNRKEEEEETND